MRCKIVGALGALCWLLATCAELSDPTRARAEPTVTVCAAAPDGAAASGAALAEVAALVVRAAGVRAAAAGAALCGEGEGGALAALSARRAAVALVPVAAARPPAAPRLRDAGLEALGDAAPAWRRACYAAGGPARSLLDLADPKVAALYRVSPDRLPNSGNSCVSGNCTFSSERCSRPGAACATLLTRREDDAALLADVAARHGLLASAVALGPAFRPDAASAEPRIVCDRSLELADPFAPLGPPPCRGAAACPFEARRLLKLADVRALAEYPSVVHALVHLSFDNAELAELGALAAARGPAEAARRHVAAHPPAAWPREARVAVLLPATSRRAVRDAGALQAAARLAEVRFARSAPPRAARLKVELFDTACSAPRAYKYLTDALGTGEYGALSALAGPACREAFADVARQSAAHELPVLAYTPQAGPAGAGAAAGGGGAAGGRVLLAAGDSRASAALWAALLARLGWRRLAVLSEPATAADLDVPALQALDVAPFRLVGDYETLPDHLAQWAKRTVAAERRIVYACLEDARVLRAALCAGWAAGLTPEAGAVWLLPDGLPDDWLLAGAGDAAPCAADELRAAAEGHLRARAAWRDAVPEGAAPQGAAPVGPAPDGAAPDGCAGCGPDAALLLDVLALWGAALRRLLAARPAALLDLHRPEHVSALVEDATTTNYTGLTGPFEWSGRGGLYTRRAPLVVQQWRDGSYRRVGRWERGALSLDRAALRWATSGGRAPADGPRCALPALAALLGGDCRAALAALAAAPLLALLAALGALAALSRRRAERRYRERLAALELRPAEPKPRGLARWELPRERVVINRKLGTGAFGTVYGGHALLAEGGGWTAVAVKTLKAGASAEEKLDFLSEAEAMKRFEHGNVVKLLGVVTATEPVCTVMEFMLYGDLKTFLLARRHLAVGRGAEGAGGAGGAGGEGEVSARWLTSAALGVARGLSYLAQQRYVHRDVAARNCLVSAGRAVKLADFGMARLVFEHDYYRFSRKGLLPVRWMAPESLALGVFSAASDVWALGVLLYEMVTFGSLPFQGLANAEVLARVKGGRTLDLPVGLKPQLEGLIKSCWCQDYKARPTAADVAAFLADAPRLLTPCLDVPLDALALTLDDSPRDRAEARWVSWGAPASAHTDTTYLSDAPLDATLDGTLDATLDATLDDQTPPPRDTDAFLPELPD